MQTIIAQAVSFGALNYTILFVYLAAMVLVGVFLAGRQKSSEEYFLAGRQMPGLIVGMSMFASLTSATTYMGVPGIGYGENVALFFGVIASLVVAPVLIFLLYPVYRRLNVTTSYEYILHRFGKTARVTVSGLFIMARLGWMGAVIFAPALALNIAVGMNLYLAIVLMAILATAYTALGGLRAVLWTDVAQFIILIVGAIWVSISLVNAAPDGISTIISNARSAGRLDVFRWPISFYEISALPAFIAFFLIFLQDYGTDQVTVQRLLSVRTNKGLAFAIIFNSFVDVLLNGMLLFIGLGLLSFYAFSSNTVPQQITPDKMLPFYIASQLPPGVSGLIITAIFAAAMSSMDSGIHSLVTVVINDFVKPCLKTPWPQSRQVAVARMLTVAAGLAALGMAFIARNHGSIIGAWSSFIGLFAGPILAIFLLGIFTRKVYFIHWLLATAIAIPVTAWLNYKQGVHWVYVFPCCFAISFVLGLLLSRLISLKKPLFP